MSTLKDLARIISDRYDLAQQDSEVFISTMFDIIKEQLTRDEQVKIKGLGTFKVQNVPERASVNVNTGEKIIIDSHDRINFTPDNSMKDSVNKPFAHFETVSLNDGVDFDDMETGKTDSKTTRPTIAPVEVAMEPLVDEPVEYVQPKPSYKPIPTPPSVTPSGASGAQGAAGAVGIAGTVEEVTPVESSTEASSAQSGPIRFGDPKPEVKPIHFGNNDIMEPSTNKPEPVQSIPLEAEPVTSIPVVDQPTVQPPAATETVDIRHGVSDAEPTHIVRKPIAPTVVATEATVVATEATNSAAPVPVPSPSSSPSASPSSSPSAEPSPSTLYSPSAEPTPAPQLLTPVEITSPSPMEQATAAPSPQPVPEEDDKPAVESVSSSKSKKGANDDDFNIGTGLTILLALLILLVGFIVGRATSDISFSDIKETISPTPKKIYYHTIHQVVYVKPKATTTIDSLKIKEAEIKEQIAKQEEAKRLAAEKAAAEKEAAEKAEAERLAAEQKELDHLAALKAKKAAEAKQKTANTQAATASSRYDSDPRVRLGAYRITGVAQTVTVNKGQTLASISKAYLGKGMECYVEAINGGIKEVSVGQKLKIPALELKRKK